MVLHKSVCMSCKLAACLLSVVFWSIDPVFLLHLDADEAEGDKKKKDKKKKGGKEEKEKEKEKKKGPSKATVKAMQEALAKLKEVGHAGKCSHGVLMGVCLMPNSYCSVGGGAGQEGGGRAAEEARGAGEAAAGAGTSVPPLTVTLSLEFRR